MGKKVPTQADDYNFINNFLGACTQCPLCDRLTMSSSGICDPCMTEIKEKEEKRAKENEPT